MSMSRRTQTTGVLSALRRFLLICSLAAFVIAVLISVGVITPTLRELAISFSLFVAGVACLLACDE
jgi:hypothetical protein